MKEKTEKKANDLNRLPHYRRRSLSWAAYAISNGLQTGLMVQMSFYLTDRVFMSIAMVSAIIAASRIFDGVSDIIAGLIIDRTKTRWGNARPWSLMSIVMWIAVVAVFSVPDISNIGKIIYVFIMYNMSESVGRTMLLAAESVHLKKGFNETERVSVLSTANFVAGIAVMPVMVFMPVLINSVGATKSGWTIIAICFAVPGIVLGILKFFFVPEMDYAKALDEKKASRVPVKVMLKSLFGNKYLLIFILAVIMVRIISGYSMGTYYFTHVVKNLNMMSVVAVAQIGGMLITPFIPMLNRKLGIRKFVMIFGIIGGIVMALPFLAPKNMVLLAMQGTANMLFGLPISVLTNVILIQCMQYTEWKDGVRIDGIISAVNSFTMKVGNALGAVVSGALLSIAGYSGALAEQSSGTILMLKFLYIGLPAIAMFLSGAVMYFYKLEKKMPEIEKDLLERNGELEVVENNQ